MAWSTPRTWTSTILTASDLNTDVRDNLNILKTRIADNGNPLFDRAGGAAKTTTYNATTADVVIDAGGSSDWTLTLYAVSGNAGRVLFVKNTGTATVTIDGNASETIDGATTLALPPEAAVALWCTGAAWFTIADVRESELILQRAYDSDNDATTTSTSWFDTDISIALVPKVVGSTVRCFVYGVIGNSGAAGSFTSARLMYNNGSDTQMAIVDNCGAGGGKAFVGEFSMVTASRATHTFKVQITTTSGGTAVWRLDAFYHANSQAHLKIEEVITR